jgi:ferritin
MEIKKFKQNREEVNPSLVQETKTQGIVNPNRLDEETISLLNERIKDEYTAHYFYRSAANWCKNMNYKKAASFFDAEADSELTHAKGIQDYMADWNVIPNFGSDNDTREFSSLVDIINNAYEMELGLMNEYNKNSSTLFTNDLTTFDFLQDYRKIQKDAVIEYSDLLNALLLIDNTDKFQVLYFEQTYF